MKGVRIFFTFLIINFVNSQDLTTGAEFLSWGVGASALAVAEAYSSVPSNLSVFYNPAGLAFLKNNQISFFYAPLYRNLPIEKDMFHSSVIFSRPFFGCGFIYFSAGRHENKPDDWPYLGIEYGKASIDEWAIYISKATKTKENLSFGFSLKYIYSGYRNVYLWDKRKFVDLRKNAISLDIGCLYVLKNMNIGLCIKNLGGYLRGSRDFPESATDENVELHREIRLAMALTREPILISFEVGRTNEQIFVYFLGIQWEIVRDIFLRIGWCEKGGRLGGINFGLGIKKGRINIDGAYSNIPGGELSRFIKSSLTFSF